MTCARHLRIRCGNHPLTRTLPALLTLLALHLLCGKLVTVARAASTPLPTASTNNTPEAAVPAASIRSCPDAERIVAQTISFLTSGLSTNTPSRETLDSEVVSTLRKELAPLESAKKMEDSKAVSEAVTRATSSTIVGRTRSFSVEGPMGSKVLAVYKKAGEIVHRGEKIATVLHNGRELPIVAKVDGMMQEISISKGGVLGNHLPSSAQRRDTGSVKIATITTSSITIR